MAGPFKLDNQYANYAGHWAANTAYAQGKRVIAESANAGNARKYVFEATTGGTSQDPGPPTWDVTPGNTTSDGTVTWTCREATTWANAHGWMQWICLRPAAGEILHVDDGHSEVPPDGSIWAFNGTEGNPVRVLCVDKTDDSACAGYATGAMFDWRPVGAFNFQNITGEVYFWGITLKVGATSIINNPSKSLIFEKCHWNMYRNVAQYFDIKQDNTTVYFVDSDLSLLLDDSHYIKLYFNSNFIWRGGSLIGSVSPDEPTKLFDIAVNEGSYLEITGVDLSAMNGGQIITCAEGNERLTANIKGIKLGASPPALISSGISPERCSQTNMDIADNGNTVYKFRREYQYGYAQDETTKVITGKALYDGTNEFAVKMVSRATPTCSFYDPWRYHLTTLRETGFAANRTYTVHIAQDHASVQPDALENDEIWLEVVYPDDSTAQFNIANDKIATPTTTPAAQTTSTESWEGLAATTRLQELAVTINSADGKNGPVEIWVCMAKADKTIYACPEVYVS